MLHPSLRAKINEAPWHGATDTGPQDKGVSREPHSGTGCQQAWKKAVSKGTNRYFQAFPSITLPSVSRNLAFHLSRCERWGKGGVSDVFNSSNYIRTTVHFLPLLRALPPLTPSHACLSPSDPLSSLSFFSVCSAPNIYIFFSFPILHHHYLCKAAVVSTLQFAPT